MMREMFFSLIIPRSASPSRTVFGKKTPGGRFVQIDVGPGSVTIEMDRYRLLNPMAAVTTEGLWVGNDLRALPRELHGRRDAESARDLRDFGVVPYPFTLFEGLRFVTGGARWTAETGDFESADHADDWPVETRGRPVDQWVSILKNTLTDLHRTWQPRTFRLSGGADTRLISFLLAPEILRSMKAQTLAHPQLDPAQDRDVLGARSVADHFGLALDVLQPLPRDYNYVLADEPPLAGVYGGEFLGGLMSAFSPLAPVLRAGGPAGLSPRLRARFERLGWRRFTTEIFLSSFRSTIYNSVSRSWASPYVLNLLSLSPYVERDVLDALLETPFPEIENYALYAKILKAAAGPHAALPLNSPLTSLQNGFVPITGGTDAKSLATPTEKTGNAPHLGALNLENFFSEFEARHRA